jgi:hypothetical protein
LNGSTALRFAATGATVATKRKAVSRSTKLKKIRICTHVLCNKTGLILKGTICWDVTLCSLVEFYRNFGKIYLSVSVFRTEINPRIKHEAELNMP